MKNFLTALLILLFINASAQKYEWQQATSGDYTYRYVTNDPTKTRFYTLPNGLTVILSANKETPRIQTLFGTRAGSNNDPSTNTGLAHYLEHLLFKGTDKFGSLDWNKEKPLLDRIDALYEEYHKIPFSDTLARRAKYHEIDSVSGEAAKYAIANEYDKMMAAIGSQGTNAHTWVEETVYEENIPANTIDQFLAVQSERFRAPVLRLFHTELEAVYEEKNRGLDSDPRKVFEMMLKELFPTSNYGQQSTIGTVEHLKNPSLIEIRNFYNKYYVPNNMALVMVGDFDADAVIKKIDNSFKWWQTKQVTPYTPTPEKPIAASIQKDVYGPTPDNFMMGWRMAGFNEADYKNYFLSRLAASILYNGTAGLIDLNINQQQKALRADAGTVGFKDYSALYMEATPKADQTLDDVKQLLLDQVNKLKAGNYDDKLITAIVANQKKNLLESLKDNSTVASFLMDDYIKSAGKLWNGDIAEQDILKTFTKADVTAFANKYLSDGYVAVYKHKGVDTSIAKVPKPAITPVQVNRDAQSDFLKKVIAMPETPIKPVFEDYSKDFKTAKAGTATVYYIQNKDNDLFRLYYRFDIGNWNNKYLSLAAQYLDFLGTDKMSSQEVSKKFYELASSFNINATAEYTTITITGLNENFAATVKLFEDLLHNCKADDEALKQLIARTQKQRADNKLNKNVIMSGLTSYALYGKKNPFNYTLTNEELESLTADKLLDVLHSLTGYQHSIIYFGPQQLPAFTTAITALHKLPAAFKANPETVNYTKVKPETNRVLYADYDMVQAEIRWVRPTENYDTSHAAVIELFNNYLGAGGMSGVVFQTIRESKALAYSTYAVYQTPVKKDDQYVFQAYVGTQADKTGEAVKSMNELINDLPQSDKLFISAKEFVRKDIETHRPVDEDVIFDYLNAKRFAINTDIHRKIYQDVNSLTYNDIASFSKNGIASKPYTYCIVASEKRLTPDQLKPYGEVSVIPLEEIFGY